MAGGVGSRFWPSSRTNLPKQFLDIMGNGKSLLRTTFDRCVRIVPPSNIYIITNGRYKTLVKEHLSELTDNQILCEPSRNNTAPCITYATLKLRQANPSANMVVVPADHIILKEDVFVEKINEALQFTSDNDAICTLGIEPHRPDTGYGYLECGDKVTNTIHKLEQFREKPDLETAKSYLRSNNYLWNAGIFIFGANTMIDAIQQYEPQIYNVLSSNLAVYNTKREQEFINKHYPKTDSISIDYAVMERADNVYTLPANIGWSDIGTWSSLHHESDHKDKNENTVLSDKSLLENVKNTLIKSDKLVIAKNMDDYIIVDEDDVLLIWPKSEEQEIKGLTKLLKEKYGNRYI